ncbi:hypothetical protein FM113_08975 [Leucobacter sp. 7(1)]|uniref:Uncharacterized protein n=1 Tax=Microbacterium esteraromaticum TaxID=57043 RepID=A0A1R4JX79_9MICO|nr:MULTISPECIES: hypothetical protein [Microbacteriaceae]SJN10379.1 hypothetical protein FM113_08975 [Leucobacter sp. 7(1)]SJN36504.1 hypothetical protein FM104_09265 [Microbacterium esteraromaticum]
MEENYPPEIRRIVARIELSWLAAVDVGPGWYPLLGRLDERLSSIAPAYVVQQVKSKFGSLSFYARASEDPYDYNEEFHEAIRAAEWESIETCEECGAPARTYTIRMWVWTLCADHARERTASQA